MVRHFKLVGILFRPSERDAYMRTMIAHTKAIETNNEFFVTLEQPLRDVPRAAELTERVAVLEAQL
ncbi:hypothetical protein F2Q69_00004551 [Brassica cretica]|uniref:Uncharacterized protein n=1 Tax=Brassica cretica TaxID=69181 RepID=A0A8S9NMI4_BRACR|nr:hypothetical protein F2Q69_00004551 [Brassica cretica]